MICVQESPDPSKDDPLYARYADAKEHYERSKVIRGNSLKSIYVGQPFTHFCDRIGKKIPKKELASRFGK
jgi:hypothetical protein